MKRLKPGDLVRYIGKIVPVSVVPNHGAVVPPKTRPYGLIIDIEEIEVGGDPLVAGVMHMVLVDWFDKSWNSDKTHGFSEEVASDLELIQKGNHND